MNWEGCRRKQSRSNLRHYPWIQVTIITYRVNVGASMILKCILNKWRRRLWNGFTEITIWHKGGLLWARLWSFEFCKIQGTSWPADQQLLSQGAVTYLLTELSPSWRAANCAATQELPSILWNPKVQYRVHRSPPLVLSWAISIQSTPSQPISLRSILILSTTYVLVFPVVSFLLAFPPISYMHSSSPPCVLCALHISKCR
jgi:hypothetical protein